MIWIVASQRVTVIVGFIINVVIEKKELNVHALLYDAANQTGWTRQIR